MKIRGWSGQMVLVGVLSLLAVKIHSQETVFTGLKSNLKRADQYFHNQSYVEALDLYKRVEKSNKKPPDICLKLARTCFKLNQMELASAWFEKHLDLGNELTAEDSYWFAESLTVLGRYPEAIAWLKKYQEYNQGNQDIIKKIWRLQNIRYLYNDSSYYEIRPVSFNTEFAEFGATRMGQQLIFVSNRKEEGGIDNVDGTTGQAFQSLYRVSFKKDSLTGEIVYDKPRPFLQQLNHGLHQGPIAQSGDRLIYTKSYFDRAGDRSVLQLFWVVKDGRNSVIDEPFQYNSKEYSLSYPCLSPDGRFLFFVSDMPGGNGGTDIYYCKFVEGSWGAPKNVGSLINTSGDETAPFLHADGTLFFASNGQGGLGGFDVFKVNFDQQNQEVENLGYPINSAFDDFGLSLNEEGTHGYLASNRSNGGFNDDLYEVVIDLQSYPLTINGTISYNDPDWAKPDSLLVLPKAKLELIDHLRGLHITETTTDSQGAFTLEIPYSSKYKLKVISSRVGQPTVSLEIPKNKKQHLDHQIVVIKEKYHTEAGTVSTKNKKKETP